FIREGGGCSSDPCSKSEMAPEEVAFLVRIAAKLGVRSVKLTGGEPLLYNGIEEVVRMISSIDSVRDVSMTTNGVLLSEWAQTLAKAGLKRVNVSLDTLSKEKYKRITGKDALERVIEGVDAALKAELKPVKLNMVLLRGINVSELGSMIEFSRARRGSILQVIELVPSGSLTLEEYHVDPSFVERMLKEKSTKVVVRKMQRRKKFFLDGGGEVEVVRPVHNSEFCASCNRLRITSDGKLKPCLMRNDNLVDVLTPLRQGASEKDIEKLFVEAVNKRSPYYH
ncbi:MAG: GTP 3',8-cyclase MoaA, partial [Candidatus Freyarchaeota archaeon]|nr:GTP 3',8-cyclase MoaA [Candidatus Jordarchaeia archaeon]